MKNSLKKIVATFFTVATCAVSMTAITSNALYIYNTDCITPYTVSFTANGHKYSIWHEMNDYFDDENKKFFISEDSTKNILLSYGNIVWWGFYGYELQNEEDVASLTKYLSDNNIPYTQGTGSEHTHIDIIDKLYTQDEYFQLLQKIKEDTGFVQIIISPSNSMMIKNLTDIENVLPEPTLLGDANEDGKVTIADAVTIMQYIVNPDEFGLTPQGMANADIYGDGDGITVMDALRIQEIQLGL
ncbi:MAG: dockerin type I repeat-containing protein [Ruminococcus sp.]|nr:dockerin type I repeat-containing protein [Ruminococcus sp.]